MTSWSLSFLVVAILAALLGFADISGLMASVAKVLCALFTVLFAVSLFCSRHNGWLNKHKHKDKGKT